MNLSFDVSRETKGVRYLLGLEEGGTNHVVPFFFLKKIAKHGFDIVKFILGSLGGDWIQIFQNFKTFPFS